MIKQEDMDALVKMREEALDYRRKAEEELLQDMFEKNKLSSNSYDVKISKLERWVDKEKL